MYELSTKKRMAVVRLYLEGLSYNEVVARTGVSKGSVASLVAQLKAGQIPEAGDLAEEVEVLRGLAADLRRANLTPGQAVAGVTVLSRLRALGVEPADVERWAAVCRGLTSQDGDVEAFVGAALALEEVRERTGLAPEALEKKVRGLEEQAVRLEPALQGLKQAEQTLQGLEKRRQALADEVAELERRQQPLARSVTNKQKREEELARRVQGLEERAQAADDRLASARRDLETLSALGLSLEGLTGLVQRLSGIAQRHRVQPAGLQARLFRELEAMDQELGLEARVNETRSELVSERQALSKVRQEHTGLEAANRRLREEQAALKAAMSEEQKQVRVEIRATSKIAQDTVASLRQELRAAGGQALLEVQELRRQTLAVGKEVGRLEEIVESNEWLRTLVALVKGDDRVTAASVRVIALGVLRGVAGWLGRNAATTPLPMFLRTTVRSTIGELEGWQP